MPASRPALRKFLFVSLLSATCGSLASAQDQQDKAPPAPDAAKPADAPKDEAAADPFKIPEGNDPKVLQGFLNDLRKTKPEKGGLAGAREHLRKIEGVIGTVLEKPQLDEETAMMAVDLRFQILQVLASRGDEAAPADREKFVAWMTKSPIAKVADRGRLFSLASRVGALGETKDEARRKLIDDVDAFIKSGELSQERIELATAVAEMLSRLGDNELASKALEQYATSLEGRKDPRLEEVIPTMRATARFFGLVGNPMVVKGKTLGGQDFDLASLKGKVVLVDFWATWCGPCLQEMPHVIDLYRGYHGKGFEVVGISLDQKKEVLQEFVTDKKIPWIQLYPSGEEEVGWGNPIARSYGISSIPTAILVGKDGNVVSLQATGRELTRQLEKLLGPPDAPPESEKDVAPEAPKKSQ